MKISTGILTLAAISLLLAQGSLAATPDALTAASIQSDQTAYSLDWIVGDNEVIAYKTYMTQVDSSDPSVAFNLEQLFADDTISDAVAQKLSRFNLPESVSLVSLLERNSQGNIAVRMIVEKVDTTGTGSGDQLEQSLNQLMEAMEGTVQLRGELTPEGAIASFYLEERQRNLLAIFFELPVGPVRVGDSWEIDFNCISMGAGFVADQAAKVNRVAFTKVSETPNGKLAAVLDYTLAESVEGNFQSLIASGTSNLTPTSMTCSFIGQGQFLIEEGRWAQLIGKFTITATGLMEGNTTQLFALTPLEDLPQ